MVNQKILSEFSVINNLIKAIEPAWSKFIEHPFGHKMVSNQITNKGFAYYLHQDAFYLKTYLDALYLLRSKARNDSERNFASQIINFIDQETEMNKDMMEAIQNQQFNDAPQSTICFAYSNWFYQIAHQHDFLGLLIALTPCPVGYYFFGQYWKNQISKITKPIFVKWINYYITPATQTLIITFCEFLETYKSVENYVQYYEKIVTIFKQATLFEINFFNQELYETK